MALEFELGEKKFLFIHIYKTGGTSVRRVLPHKDSPYGRERGGGHCAFSDIKDLYLEEERKSFSIVRNPYDWMYSHYAYIKRVSGHKYHEAIRQKTFMEFLLIWKEKYSQLPWVYRGHNHCSQTRMCQGVDKVFKIEDLAATNFAALSEFLEFNVGEVPRENVNNDYKEPIVIEAKKLINELVPEDFQFGYTRE